VNGLQQKHQEEEKKNVLNEFNNATIISRTVYVPMIRDKSEIYGKR
jgi:hypothetical protein